MAGEMQYRAAPMSKDQKKEMEGRRAMPRVSSSSPRLYSAIAVAVSVLAMVIAFTFVEPPPPDSFRIAAGGPGGAYYAFAERYREVLARSKLNLEVVETAGSVENLQLLTDGGGAVEVALLQGGVLSEDPGGLVALASVFVEPLWVFYRGPARLHRLSDLAGRRLAIGAEGSGTRPLALHLLEQNGIGADDAELLGLPSIEAAAALRAGEVDALFYVANASAAVVQDLLRAPGVRLMNLSRAEAYSQRDHSMATTVLHEGAIDLARGIPDEDIELLAPTATVIAREDIHPALVSMLLLALQEVHKDGGLFELPGAYPAPERLMLPSHPEAERFFRSGPPFLQRVLPFWIANLVDRLIVLAIPLLTLIIPLARLLPPVYRWRMRARVNRLYAALARVEAGFTAGNLAAADALAELERIETDAEALQLPASYVSELYELRFYLERVRTLVSGAPAAPVVSES